MVSFDTRLLVVAQIPYKYLQPTEEIGHLGWSMANEHGRFTEMWSLTVVCKLQKHAKAG